MSNEADGFVVVPVEPDQKMIASGYACMLMGRKPEVLIGHTTEESVYKAMLRCAPDHGLVAIPAADLKRLREDAERLDWLSENYESVGKVFVQRHGFRSTEPRARRESWHEFDSWHANGTEGFATLRAAIDQSAAKGESNG